MLALWEKAEAAGALTATGEEFGPTVRALQEAMSTVGYGDLSGRGRREIHDTAARMEHRLPGLFGRIAKGKEKTDVVSSGRGARSTARTSTPGAPIPGAPIPDASTARRDGGATAPARWAAAPHARAAISPVISHARVP